jgi:hypothetical protein
MFKLKSFFTLLPIIDRDPMRAAQLFGDGIGPPTRSFNRVRVAAMLLYRRSTRYTPAKPNG